MRNIIIYLLDKIKNKHTLCANVRKEQNMIQLELDEKIGIQREQVAKIESGRSLTFSPWLIVSVKG